MKRVSMIEEAETAERRAALREQFVRVVPFASHFDNALATTLRAARFRHPEQLLFLDKTQLEAIPGINRKGVTAIRNYQRKFLPKQLLKLPTVVRGQKLASLRREMRGGDIEENVSAVRFEIAPLTGARVLIERPDGTALLISTQQ